MFLLCAHQKIRCARTRLLTTRNTGQEILQDLNYTYDPEGNIVQQTDNAQQDLYFGNEVIRPTGRYEYDALYRLTKAEGRELAGLNMPDNRDFSNEILLPDSNSPQNYSHTYTYDALGNIRQLMSISRWRRDYQYGTTDNRLLGIEGEHFEYRYDAHGNLLAMPHLETMTWDYNDRLSSSAINRDQQTFYRYDAGGNRTRKITQSEPHFFKERIYFTNFEIYRERSMDGEIITERLTNHITDGSKRIAIVDSLTIDRGQPIEPVTTIRYQYDNHLGSACLELDEQAAIISYEEYHPFGTTSYRSGRSLTETSLKRYKYVGKERDEETGLYYYGARYYAAWLCRFVSVDPLQFKYNWVTPYNYAENSPVSNIDLWGLQKYYAGDGSLIGSVGRNNQVMLVAEKNIKAVKFWIDAANLPPEGQDKGYSERATKYANKYSKDTRMTSDELNIRAFMSTLKQTENGGKEALPYNAKHIIGNKLEYFTEKSYNQDKIAYLNHPYQNAKDKSSTASGAYQILLASWINEQDPELTSRREKWGITDFSPINQDIWVLSVLVDKRKDSKAFEYIKSGNWEKAANALKTEWVSLPGGSDAQVKPNEFTELLMKNLSNELKGESNLKINQGELLKNKNIK